MYEIFLIFSFIFFWFILKRLTMTTFNSFLLIMGPYLIIIIFNNIYAVNYGFFRVNNEAILVHFLAFSSFFAGATYKAGIINPLKNKKNRKSWRTNVQIDIYDPNFLHAINSFVFIVGVLGLVNVFLSIRTLYSIGDGNLEHLAAEGIIGHLLLGARIFVPILLDVGLQKKKKLFLISSFLIIIVTFSSFIKYHIISFVLYLYSYFFWKINKKVIKYTFLLIICVFSFFSINYIIDFYSKGHSYDVYGTSFYFRHFWRYVAGGTIKVNEIVGNKTVTYNMIDFIVHNTFTYPNMFIQKIGLNVIKPIGHFGTAEGYTLIGNNINTNVISLLGQMYNSGAILPFIFLTFLFGLIAQSCWDTIRYSQKINKVLSSASIYAFFLFSFFHNMWRGSIQPWELMIFAYFLPVIFWRLTRRISFGRKI
jgi:hypothetical protein